MSIEIKQEQQGALRILGLAGRLDTETAVDVELALQDLLGAGERQFLIDLSGIGYVSSAGLRVLLNLAKQLDGGKGSLRLCGLNASVQQVFDVAGFSKLFTILRDRDAALKLMPPPAVQATAVMPKPESPLALKVAELIGASPKKNAALHPQAAELARLAAQLLGVRTPAMAAAQPAPAASAPKPVRAAKPTTVAPAANPPSTAAPKAGLIDKLKGLFGKR